jgi:hypothetical protein
MPAAHGCENTGITGEISDRAVLPHVVHNYPGISPLATGTKAATTSG